ncbi:response regulator transcription factor [Flavobacterium phycosphaerae]|uniref:response regulator transcription factor n=1 Tax=Flavobacterium phycosphaerae TaxID=2697515 RepID=UPI00138ADA0F|nr:response regulator transcription factor [Flavobacterium phycosphaerae]
MITVAIFEDHPVVLRSLVSFLNDQPAIEVVFTAKSKTELHEKLIDSPLIDVFIVDLLGIDIKGLEVYEFLCKNYADSKVISFTSLASAVLVDNLLAIGVKGYVNKNQDLEDLVEAILLVHEGHISLPEDYAFMIKKTAPLKPNSLSEREIEIVQLIAREFTTSDIATELNISINTVENHRKSIFVKLDVKNVAGMIREVAKLGYLSQI